MPANYKVEIFKSAYGENWANVYLIDASSLEAAQAAGALLYDAEVEFHLPAVTFDYMRVSTIAAGDNSYITVPLGNPGEGTSSGDVAPLFVTARFDVPVDGGGRPSRKFYRGVLSEVNYTANSVDAGWRSGIASIINTAVAAAGTLGTPVVDPQGQEWGTGVFYNKPQMRQLHRKRRSTTPTP
jgi:hypothetical protein